MSEWHDYVQRWSALSEDQRRDEWVKLTPEQQQAFERARIDLSQGLASSAARKPRQRRSVLRWAVGLGAGAFFLIALLATVFDRGKKGSTQGASSPAACRDGVEAGLLVAKYEADWDEADRLFLGRPLTICGVVEKVGTDLVGDRWVILKGPNRGRALQCYFSAQQENTLGRLNPGEYVALYGICTGRYGNIQFMECRPAR